MLTYTITPFRRNNFDEVPRLATNAYARLFRKPLRSAKLTSEFSEFEIEATDGFSLRIVRLAGDDAAGHPVEELIKSLSDLRYSHESDELTIPGQAYGRTYSQETDSPTEGVVVVLCSGEDWNRPMSGSELGWDPIPGLSPLPKVVGAHEVESGASVPYLQVDQGNWMTADGRGFIIDHSVDFDHADFVPEDPEQVCDEEIAPLLVELAIQHAVRTFDIQQAAQAIDALSSPDTSTEKRVQSLQLLRSLQVRIMTRGVESLLENRNWQSFLGHDSFRLQQVIRWISARFDQELSSQFISVQPVLETAAAELAAQEADNKREVEASRRRELQEEQLAARERLEERDARIKSVTSWAGALIGGVALVGLFAALAAIPTEPVTFQPFPRAAFVAIAMGGIVAAFALGVNYFLTRGHGTDASGGRVWRWGGGILVVLSVVAAAALSAIPEAATAAWLFAVLAALGAGVLCFVYGYNPEARK